jgi:hydrogenase maturation protease
MSAQPAPIRIIAWGNRGRRDDGVALALAERLEARYASDPQVVVQQYHQLGPELADDLCHARRAIFIDADVREASPEVSIEPLAAASPEGLNTHHCPPDVLLGLGESLGWEMPPSFLVCVKAHDLGFGDDLTPQAQAAMDSAEQGIIRLVNAARCGGSRHA